MISLQNRYSTNMKRISCYFLLISSILTYTQASDLNMQNDSLWKLKLQLYEKSKTQFLRTKVVSGKKGIADILKGNRGVLLNIDEIFIMTSSHKIALF